MRHLIIAVTAAGLASCATTPDGPRPAVLAVTMTGVQEVPGPGDPDGTGTAEIRVEPGQARVCWNVYARDIGTATAAHIHRGAEGVAGPVAVPLATPGADGHSQGCSTVDPALAAELSMRSHEFYVNVHSTAFPNGAIRGQLRGGPIQRESARDRPTG